jgi:hypothetical protein
LWRCARLSLFARETPVPYAAASSGPGLPFFGVIAARGSGTVGCTEDRGVFGGSNVDAKLLLLARRLRARAEGVLAKAETMQNPDAKQEMLQIAASYENLAQQIEHAAMQTRYRCR